ncbi:MAG: RES family NAD+ phosphorylase [Bacteroidota bacterium]|nr:RES family NAD+ phosphorylase [Bacteroidota bacterium]
MKLYRIALKKYISDLSGTGAYLYGGRWNSPGIYVLYASSSASLAVLEFICNSNNLIAACKMGMAQIDLPAFIKLKTISLNELPPYWNNYPTPMELKSIGDNWAKENKTLALKVPSAVINIEYNILINPAHPDFQFIELSLIDDFIFDKRLS